MNIYQQKILELYTKYPKHAVRFILSESELMNWIESNCDPSSPDNLSKIYTAYHGEHLLCPCGSGKLRRCKRFNRHLSACGNTKICSYAKELHTANRKSGMMKKYGCENPMQSNNIKHHFKNVIFEKYGVENISQISEVKRRKEQTSLKKNGAPYLIAAPEFRKVTKEKLKERYNVSHPSQMKYSENTKNILFDSNNLENFLLEYGFTKGHQILGISLDTLYRAHDALGLKVSKRNSSSYESEIENWLRNNNVNFEQSTRKVIPPFELDFYLPDHKLAIEFDGLYWHSEANGKDKNYHLNKTLLCEEKGIRLVHIFEDEWVHKKGVCLDILSRILTLNQTKIMARKCNIRVLTNRECKEFENTNHLQGYVSASVNLGLEFNGELVQLLTFKKSRYNRKVEWEIIRQVNRIGFQITGGLQKLWTFFMKNYSPNSIVSYCDRRWFQGESYTKLKFVLEHITSPQYWYVKPNALLRMHRMSFQKKKCIVLASALEKLEILQEMTESEITRDILQLDRIWDCGQQTWIWKR